MVITLEICSKAVVGTQSLSAPVQSGQRDDEPLYSSFIGGVSSEQTVQRLNRDYQRFSCDTQIGQFQLQPHPAALQGFTARKDPIGITLFR